MLGRSDLVALLDALEVELERAEVVGELYLVGGAVMCLAHQARPATKDMDGYFVPAAEVRKAAEAVAEARDLPRDWLNDAVKGFLSEHGDFTSYRDGAHLRVFVATPEYLLAMKCYAMRLGTEFQDEADVRYLLRYLNVTEYQAAVDIIERYYPARLLPQKTFYALAEMLGGEVPG